MIKNCAIYSVLLVVLAIGFQLVVNIALRKEYKSYKEGVVIISGTSTGIGHDSAFDLATRGYVVFCGVRSEKDIQLLTEEAKSRKLESKIRPILLDVVKSDQINAALTIVTDFLASSGLPLVGVVNNAGITLRYPIEVAPLDVARNVFDVNLWGAVEITQKFLPLIRKYEGRIVFISSLAGITSYRGNGYYSASKRAMEGIVESLRQEMLPFGVSVTSILPGYINTSISTKVSYTEQEKANQVYASFFKNIVAKRKQHFDNSAGTEVTSADILHALSDPYPKTKYYPGNAEVYPGWLVPYLVSYLPDRLLDILKKDIL